MRLKKLKKLEKSNGLTPKQRKFCEYFLKYQDEYKAYKKAGYSGTGDNKIYARKLLQRNDIRDYIGYLEGTESTMEELEDLTARQARFVIEYLQDFNQAAAKRRVGYSKKNTSQSLLRHPKIKKAIRNILKRKFRFLQLTEQDLLTQLARIIFFDPRDLYDEKGKLIPITELDDDAVTALQSMEVLPQRDEKGKYIEVKKIRFASRIKAIELYGRFLSMWQDNVNLNAKIKAGVMIVPGVQGEWGEVVKRQNELIARQNALSKDEEQIADLE